MQKETINLLAFHQIKIKKLNYFTTTTYFQHNGTHSQDKRFDIVFVTNKKLSAVMIIWIVQGARSILIKWNVIQIPITDIDGLWTYIHFSYSLKAEQEKYQTVIISAVYPKFLILVVSGSDLDLYPGFNGQFSSPIIKLGHGSNVSTEAELKEFVFPIKPVCDKQYESNLVQRIKKYDAQQKEIYKMRITYSQRSMPLEVDLNGIQPSNNHRIWHSELQLTIRRQIRMLNYWVIEIYNHGQWLGKFEGGSYALATYNHTNIQGAGNANQYQYIKHQDKHTEFHNIYLAYNRSKRQAYSAIWFKDRMQEKTFGKVNHFLVILQSICWKRPAYNGYVADFKFILCQDAFNPAFKPGDEPKLPRTQLLKLRSLSHQTPEAKPDQVFQEGDERILNQQLINPNLYQIFKCQKVWLWILGEIFTKNVKYDILKWVTDNQQSGYVKKDTHFLKQQILNSIRLFHMEILREFGLISITFIPQIENKGVGILKYGDKDYKSVTLDVFHTKLTYLRLIIGGRYEIIFIYKYGIIYILVMFQEQYSREVMDHFMRHQRNSKTLPPNVIQSPRLIVQRRLKWSQYQLLINTNYHLQLSMKQLQQKKIHSPLNFSISGWLVQIHISQDGSMITHQQRVGNKNAERLGDRTLAVWASPISDGIYAFATYTQTNLNGAGNPNLNKAHTYGKDLTSWHFIRFGSIQGKKRDN
ncbi:hypothetical protein pb186bvf_005354 [Paramecium bursaria]